MTDHRHEKNGVPLALSEELAILATTRVLDRLTPAEEDRLLAADRGTLRQLAHVTAAAERLAPAIRDSLAAEDDLPDPSVELRGAVESKLCGAVVLPATGLDVKAGRSRRGRWIGYQVTAVLVGIVGVVALLRQPDSRKELTSIAENKPSSSDPISVPVSDESEASRSQEERLWEVGDRRGLEEAAKRFSTATTETKYPGEQSEPAGPKPSTTPVRPSVSPEVNRGLRGSNNSLLQETRESEHLIGELKSLQGRDQAGLGELIDLPEPSVTTKGSHSVESMPGSGPAYGNSIGVGGLMPGTSNLGGMPGGNSGSGSQMSGMAPGAGMPGMSGSLGIKGMGLAPGADSRDGFYYRGAMGMDAGIVAGRRVEFERQEDQTQPTNESYAHIVENEFRRVLEHPLSTFSIDVDTASYANVRRFLTDGQRPPHDAVRIEELLNYFTYDYLQPDDEDPFSVNLEVAECPWRPENRLLRIGLRGRDVPQQRRAPSNLVFLIDVSGSMQPENKLPLVKTALKFLVAELTENDRVSIVTYAGDAGLKLPSTNGSDSNQILAAIDSLSAGGSTHGSAGIELAYAQASEYFISGGTNRVILLTDGDLNVGVTDDDSLVQLIKQKATGGVFLTVLGVGTGNLKDSKMEKLADHGNGVYAYLDGIREARKVFVEQMAGNLITIAKDVKFQIEFNPAQVMAYRLIGYENRVLAHQDFHDDTKDAGEIGAGHTVTALYELVPANAAVTAEGEPLKYQPQRSAEVAAPARDAGIAQDELLTMKLRFKRPDGDRSQQRNYPLVDRGEKFGRASADFRFAASVAMFGLVLRESNYRGSSTLAAVEEIASAALGTDSRGYRAEFVDLVRKAEQLR